ncbi:hypothetical protein KY359_00365 [Candidatus Woesearchaeota archaeon]|nr:hypothetical protein [Candidatus Woesearchaeota archaeon]
MSGSRKSERCRVDIGIEDSPEGSFLDRKYFLELTSVNNPHNVWRMYITVDQYQHFLDNPAGVASASVEYEEGKNMTRLELRVRLYHNRKA